MSLDGLWSDQTVRALGWTLIHFLWQGVAVGALFAAGSFLLRRLPPTWRYGYGLLALAALGLCPLATFLLLLPESASPQPSTGLLSLPVLAAGAAGGLAPARAADLATLVERWLPWVVAAWGTGVLAHSLRVYVNWRRMRRITVHGVRPVGAALALRTRELGRLLGVDRAVTVLESRLVVVPTVLGWFKPVILLPTATLVGLTPRQVELVLAHELCHVRRWDYLVNLLQVCLETALFYHPVVRWISRRVREEREKCCDDLVVSHCGQKLEYARALHNLEAIRAGELSPALAASEGKLFERIERIVGDRDPAPRDAVAGNTLFLILLGATLLLGGRLADPMGLLELRRTALADALVEELLLAGAARHSDVLFVPLDGARLRPEPDPPPRSGRAEATAGPAPGTTPGAARPADAGEAARTDPPRRTAPPPAGPAPATARGERSRPAAGAPPEPAAARAQEPARKLAPAPGARAVPEGGAGSVAAASGGGGAAPAAAGPAGAAEPEWPVPIERRAPEYPVRARMAGKSGYVELSFVVGVDGRPRDIEVLEAYPRRVFEKSSIRALRRWRFDRSSRAAGVDRVTQRFDFSLDRASPLIEDRPRGCQPLTGTRICRTDSPTYLKAREAASS